jgi:hypothetical protein
MNRIPDRLSIRSFFVLPAVTLANPRLLLEPAHISDDPRCLCLGRFRDGGHIPEAPVMGTNSPFDGLIKARVAMVVRGIDSPQQRRP